MWSLASTTSKFKILDWFNFNNRTISSTKDIAEAILKQPKDFNPENIFEDARLVIHPRRLAIMWFTKCSVALKTAKAQENRVYHWLWGKKEMQVGFRIMMLLFPTAFGGYQLAAKSNESEHRSGQNTSEASMPFVASASTLSQKFLHLQKMNKPLLIKL